MYRVTCDSCGYVLWGGTAEFDNEDEADDQASDADGYNLACPDCESYMGWTVEADEDAQEDGG